MMISSSQRVDGIVGGTSAATVRNLHAICVTHAPIHYARHA